MSDTRLVNVRQLCTNQPGFNEAGVRWILFKAQDNGLAESGAVIRLGRKVLIDEPKFLEWVKSRAKQAA